MIADDITAGQDREAPSAAPWQPTLSDGDGGRALMTMRIRPWQVEPGDVILGTGLQVAGKARYSQSERGSNLERQCYTIPLNQRDQTTTAITYNGESWVTVIRGSEVTCGSDEALQELVNEEKRNNYDGSEVGS